MCAYVVCACTCACVWYVYINLGMCLDNYIQRQHITYTRITLACDSKNSEYE